MTKYGVNNSMVSNTYSVCSLSFLSVFGLKSFLQNMNEVKMEESVGHMCPIVCL